MIITYICLVCQVFCKSEFRKCRKGEVESGVEPSESLVRWLDRDVANVSQRGQYFGCQGNSPLEFEAKISSLSPP